MSRLPRWVHLALSPTRGELKRLETEIEPELLEVLRARTEPERSEVDALVRRLNTALPQPRRGGERWAFGGAALVVAAVLAVVMVWQPWTPNIPEEALPTGEVVYRADLAVGEIQQLSPGTSHALGPSIALRADGRVRILEAGPDGTRVVLEDGSATFDVDPEGMHRALRVLVGPLDVRVTGTVFEVSTAPYPSVRVTRGSVVVQHGERRLVIRQGEQYSLEPEVAIAVPAPPVPTPAASEAPLRVAAPEAVSVPRRIDPSLLRIGTLQEGLAAGTMPPDEAWAILQEPGVSKVLASQPSLANDLEAAILLREVTTAPGARVVARLTAFLSRAPDHPRSSQLRWARATLHRDRLGDCLSALDDYRALAVDSHWQQDARVHAYRGICAHSAGAAEEAEASLKRAKNLGIQSPLAAVVDRFLAAPVATDLDTEK